MEEKYLNRVNDSISLSDPDPYAFCNADWHSQDFKFKQKENTNDMKIRTRGFEPVRSDKKKTKYEPTLPMRGTPSSMAYDFFANDDYEVQPHGIAKIWTDVKAYMQSNEGLLLCIRSSMGGKYRLINQLGVIDADYYSNENNDGNIGAFLENVTDEVMYIKRGDRICQGFFVPYLTVDNDKFMHEERIGGFGSTNV